MGLVHDVIRNAHRNFGYNPDDDKRRGRQRPAKMRYGAVTATLLPNNIGLVQYEDPLIDQGKTGHCIGAGTSQILAVSTKAAGTPLGFQASPKLLYDIPRILERPNFTVPLTDSGAMPTDLIDGMRIWGVAAMQGPTPDGRHDDVWGPDDLVGISGINPNVNDEPSLLDLETAGLRLVTGDYRIDETSADFDTLVRSALAGSAGAKPCAVGYGIFVDTGFMQWNPAHGPIDSINLADGAGGGHWLCGSYSYIDSQGRIILGGPNSWGKDWPFGGAPPESPFWAPGHWEVTAAALQRACADCLLFPVRVLS